MACSVLLPPVTLHFYLVFPRPKRVLERRRWLLTLLYGPAVAFLLLMLWAYLRLQWLYPAGASDSPYPEAVGLRLKETGEIHLYFLVAGSGICRASSLWSTAFSPPPTPSSVIRSNRILDACGGRPGADRLFVSTWPLFGPGAVRARAANLADVRRLGPAHDRLRRQHHALPAHGARPAAQLRHGLLPAQLPGRPGLLRPGVPRPVPGQQPRRRRPVADAGVVGQRHGPVAARRPRPQARGRVWKSESSTAIFAGRSTSSTAPGGA